MENKTLERARGARIIEHVTKAFGHEDEDKRGERVPLINASRGRKGIGGKIVDQDREEVRG